MTADPDEPTLARLRAGDPVALGEYVQAHGDRLRRMLEVRLDPRVRGRIGPDDVLQEAYLDAATRLSDYLANPAVPLYVWLRAVVLQRLLTVQRSHLAVKGRAVTREAAPPTPDGHPATDSLAYLFVGKLTSPTQMAVRREQQDRLRDALDAMDPTDREVLALRHFEELSNTEAAAVLGIAPSAASKRHVRALQRLKQVLGDPF